ncbi:MAG TPA: N-acetylmuramoyl-L-alanine amidase [Deinococcales bacterium]|nr:N-acetylmuramoyl-L-alanine amidase [Deinococcales bacterium]
MNRIIALDPGHGGSDPGAVAPNGRHEADAALELALTCKSALEQAGWKVMLTRQDGGQGTPDLYARMIAARNAGAAALVSIHYNSVRAGGLVYRSPTAGSTAFALRLASQCGFPTDRVWATSKSRFGRLYIDDFVTSARPAILWEVTGIEAAPPAGDAGRAARLHLAGHLVAAVRATWPG